LGAKVTEKAGALGSKHKTVQRLVSGYKRRVLSARLRSLDLTEMLTCVLSGRAGRTERGSKAFVPAKPANLER
jgi:hypothetical protein